MLRINFALSVIILGTVALARADLSEYLAVGDSHTWNSLIYGDSLIPAEFDSQIPQLGADSDVTAIQEFKSLLSNKALVSQAYANYKLQYAEQISQVPSADLLSKLHEANREEIFKESLLTIAEHNLGTLAGKSTWSQGVNPYIHLTREEFRRTFASGGQVPSLSELSLSQDPPNGTISLGQDDRSTKNWTAEGKVSSVKSQGGCGSCYAFAGLASFESKILILYGAQYNFDFAEQEIVDCTQNGCNGGNANTVYDYEQANGIEQEPIYRYTGTKSTCKAARTNSRVQLRISSSYVNGGKDNGDNLASQIYTNGPATTVLNAKGWDNYKSGVFNSGCDQNLNGDYNHVILITGYTPDVWMIKNSWGTGWGEQGFMQLSRKNNLCMASNYGNVINTLG